MSAARPLPLEQVRLVRFPRRRVRLPSLSTPGLVATYLLGSGASGLATESLWVFALDTKNAPLNVVEVSRGTVDASLVHPREVFGIAVAAAASSVIIVHNHPSGNPEPSPEDIALSRRIGKAGEIMGIPLLDSIVVGARGHVSLSERGLL